MNRETKKRLLLVLFLAGLILFHIVNNWIWLSTNVVIVGWDRPRHLIESLRYNDLLKTLNYRSFFEAFTLSGYYPPLFHLLMVAFYKLFGLSADVAAMVNSLFLALLLPSTYLIGRKVWGQREGLLAAFLVSTFPMIYAMSRYTYIEFALTAMVALGISLLLLCEGFTQRSASLAFGLSLGLGLLTKWTYALFVLPPLILIVARLPRRSWLIKPFLDRKWVGLSVALGLGLALLWYLPVRGEVAELPLGHGLFPLSWFLLSGLIYLLSREATQKANLLSSLWLGGTVAATWYLSRVDFIQHTFLIAWGRPQRREWGFSYYLDHLVNEQLSPFYVGLLALLFLSFLVLALRRRSFLSWFVKGDRALFLLWLLFPYLVFSFRASSIHSRFLMPILPALALLLSRGLVRIPGVKLRWGIIALVILVALGQFFALSYDGLGWLRHAAVIEVPGYGSINLFAHGHQNQLPNSGQTDAGYWIVPDLLEYVRKDGRERGKTLELGLLVNSRQIHEEHFLYLIYTDYPEIRLRELARNWTGRPVYPQLFEVDYVALSTDHPPHRFSEESRQSIEMILKDPPSLFEAAFEMVEGYPLPDGNTVYLYKRLYPRPEGYPPTDYEAVGEALATYSRPEDGLLIVPPEAVNLLGPYYLGQATPYLLGEELDEPRLREALTHHRRLFALFGSEEGAVEGWLNRHGYRAWESWYGGARLVLYATPLGIEEKPEFVSVEVDFGEEFGLLGYSLIDEEVKPGGVVRLVLYWEAKKEIERDYKVFIHLIDEGGQLVAQRDSQPQGGSKPTTGWEAGEKIEDRYGVWVGEGVAPGEYELVMGLYEPSSGQRLPAFDSGGRRLPEDRIPLGKVRVRG